MDDPASSFFFAFLQHTESVEPITLTGVFVDFLFILLIVGLNAFFVASEFSLVSVRRTRVQKQADEGRKGAKAAIRLLDDPTKFISAVQLGVTLASLALGWRGEPAIARLLLPLADAIADEGTA